MNFLKEDKFNELFPSNDETFKKLFNFGVFYETIPCPRCGSNMDRIPKRQVFRCGTNSCNDYQVSIRKNTFFSSSKISYLQIMKLARLWLLEIPQKSILKGYPYSKQTISTYFNYFRQLVSSSLSQEDTLIGGKDIIVEVDETKLGKRKYNRGRHVEGVWVVCGVERTKNRKVFCIEAEKRDSETLERIIIEHVKEGSIIHTDMWRGYSNISKRFNFEHNTVNHSEHFKDPATGVHTNTIEGTNYALKAKIPHRNRVADGIGERLSEFVWRRINEGRLAESFLDALRDIHYE